MPELVAPSRRFHLSFVGAVEEILESDDDDHYAGLTVIPPVGDFPGESYTLDELRDPAVFAVYASRMAATSDASAWLPPGIVPATFLWWVEGDTYLGRLSIRHSLTPWLLEFGGHIGYVVRPSARCQGHATAMLAAALPVAARLGIDPVLVTCDDTNVASRRVIEANGGVFEDQRGEKLRYWLPTGAQRLNQGSGVSG
jgi:predicted acetyltransferase